MNRIKISLLLFMSMLSGCAVNKVTVRPNGEILAAVRDVNYAVAKNKALESANEYCSTKGGGVTYLRAEQPYDNVGAAYYLYFNCFNLAEKQAEERRQRQLKAQEEARQQAINAENERQAELTRKKELAEWERTRPQREAEARRQQEAENRRLNAICPIFYVARQFCAASGVMGSPAYTSCMSIRMSNSYNGWDDDKCFRR